MFRRLTNLHAALPFPLAWGSRTRVSTVETALFVLGILLATVSCATTPNTPKRITDLKQVVGSWTGFVGCRECAGRFPAYLSILEDGRWQAVVNQGNANYGEVEVLDGALRWGQGGRWAGKMALVEERGREWLIFYRSNGDVWS
jgi:hypothetical protein